MILDVPFISILPLSFVYKPAIMFVVASKLSTQEIREYRDTLFELKSAVRSTLRKAPRDKTSLKGDSHRDLRAAACVLE